MYKIILLPIKLGKKSMHSYVNASNASSFIPKCIWHLIHVWNGSIFSVYKRP